MAQPTQAQIDAARAAQAELNEINSRSGSLGAQIVNDGRYRNTFKKDDGSVYTLAELDGLSALTSPLLSGQAALIIPMTRSDLKTAMAQAAQKGTSVFVNGVAVPAGGDPLAGVSTLAQLDGINVGPDPAYVERLQATIKAGTPTADNTPTPAAPPVISRASTPTAPLAAPIPRTAARAEPDPRSTVRIPPPAAPVVAPIGTPAAVIVATPAAVTPAAATPTALTAEAVTPAAVPIAQRATPSQAPIQGVIPVRATPASAPFTLGRITPQTTVLDLIVNGIQTSTDAEPSALRAAATEKLTEELKKSRPELADNPQALNAAVQQGLPSSIRGLILDLSKDKTIQQKIAAGFLDGMRRENPSAEQSSFYKHLKTLSSDERTFGAFLNSNMLDGITRDFEARARAENGGTVPNRVIDAVAGNIMRVKPEIQQYNDRVGQSITDFVRNPEISRQRLLHSPSTQREIREGVAKFRREHPFQTFFADLIGTNMHAEGEKRALAEMKKRGLRDKNYAREIQTGFVNELNNRTGQELRGEQLANMRAFTRHLSQLPYSRFIQEDISPRRMSSIILGIERPGEDRAPSRHLIPQHIASRPVPHVNVAAADAARAPQPQQQMQPRPAAPTSAA